MSLLCHLCQNDDLVSSECLFIAYYFLVFFKTLSGFWVIAFGLIWNDNKDNNDNNDTNDTNDTNNNNKNNYNNTNNKNSDKVFLIQSVN